ncbi:hypothetical protein MAPG_06189 [Magnaporthiopsis poae ATCC 64411]|uniref:Uncharacterized protein n=1 Tax=Magnaporthiopsis poae (strain ATCC 64411 / 73-15) TaxID=644358 RepID=A0A0C4E1D2_MAGP6|nr:hypothetical protein MAPG_06189 [Magnaporthiopsis poae ATCC 64411]
MKSSDPNGLGRPPRLKMPRRWAEATPTKSFYLDWPGRPPIFNSGNAAMSDFRPLLAPQQLCTSGSLPMDTDSRASAAANPARVPEARADSITAIPPNRPHKKEQIEPKLSHSMPEFMPSVELSALEYHQTGSHGLHPLMPTRGDPYRGRDSTMPHNCLRTIPTGHTADQMTGRELCLSPKEMSPTVAQDVEHPDLEKSAFGDDPGRNTEICPVRKRTSWDSGLCRPTTVSERPPKRLVLALLGASTAGAVLMAQWRLGDPHKQPDHPRSRTAQQGFLSHPGVLILGISLHVAALTLVYHLNGFDRRQDVFLIVTTGATATVASLLGLEVSTILLRTTPWASIVALCASTYRRSG